MQKRYIYRNGFTDPRCAQCFLSFFSFVREKVKRMIAQKSFNGVLIVSGY